jgi:hypothetical protein
VPVHSDIRISIAETNRAMARAANDMHRTVIRSTAAIKESREHLAKVDAILAEDERFFGRRSP